MGRFRTVPILGCDAAMNAEERRQTDFVRSLERGLAVIKAFGKEHPELTISDLARKTGLTRSAVRRILITLSDLGYVRSDGRVFSLQPAVLELGYAYLSSIGLPEAAQLYMEELVSKTGESCQMAILDRDEIVLIAQVPTRRILAVAPSEVISTR
jgi:IclR family pca regulon transcriptional regulator